MSKIVAIAFNTFKEAVRNRVLYVLLFFAIIVLLGAWVVSSLAIFGADKIVRDFGVASINIISVLIAVFVGVGLVYNDLDKKTIYTIISKPISRWQFLVGKFLGLLLTIVVNILFMTFFFLAVLYFRDYTSEESMTSAIMTAADGTYRNPSGAETLMYYVGSIFKSLANSILNVVSLGFYSSEVTAGVMRASMLTMLEMTVVTAFAVLFSSFSSPTLSAFMTIIVFLVGRANEDLYYFADLIQRKAGGVEALQGGQALTYWFSLAASHVSPNLAVFDQREAISQFMPVEISAYSAAYALVYAGCVLAIATIVFNRRNFK